MDETQRQELARSLIGKKVKEVQLTNESLKIVFEEGDSVYASACSGAGADSNWYNWTYITINNSQVVNT